MSSADKLAPEIVAALLPPETRRAFDLAVVEETGSTNSDLLRGVAHLPSGRVLAAERQTAGRGRRGRTWVARPGGSLAFSLLWKFARGAAGLSGLSLAVGVAVARALDRCGAKGIRLKWPNDLLVPGEGRHPKLGGILIELAGDAKGPAQAVIGIGLNLDLGAARAGIDQPVTDLAAIGARPDRNALLAMLLEELLAVLRLFEDAGFAPLAPEWNARHAFAGSAVVLTGDNATRLEGRALGADSDGALLLDTGHGVERVVGGEVSLRPAS